VAAGAARVFSFTVPNRQRFPLVRASAKLRQLRDIGRDPPRLVFAEQLGGRSPAGLILEINIGELLAAVIADNKTGVLFLDRPRWGKAAGGHETMVMDCRYAITIQPCKAVMF
jgi:hypothetical protein